MKLNSSDFQILSSILLVVVLKCVNFVLLNSNGAYQPCTINENYKISVDNAKIYEFYIV